MKYLLVPAVAVLIGMLPLPIDAYHLIRWVVACTCSYGAYKIFQEVRTNQYKGVILATIAFIFNPIIPFYFDRSFWLILDVAACGLLVWLSLGRNQTAGDAIDGQNVRSKISTRMEEIERKGDGFAKRALINAIGLLFVFGLISIFMKN